MTITQAGFAAGVLAGFLVGLALGIAIGALCATGVGCILVAVAAGSLMGSVFSSVTYVYVTVALGGTPTEAGLSHSFGWGGIAGGFGAGIGATAAGWTPRGSPTKTLPAEGADATEAAGEATQLQKNVANGAVGETRGARLLRSLDETVVENPAGRRTPYGIRYHDADVIDPSTGQTLYHVEFKTGNSPYTLLQRLKDMYLHKTTGVPTIVIRFK